MLIVTIVMTQELAKGMGVRRAQSVLLKTNCMDIHFSTEDKECRMLSSFNTNMHLFALIYEDF